MVKELNRIKSELGSKKLKDVSSSYLNVGKVKSDYSIKDFKEEVVEKVILKG